MNQSNRTKLILEKALAMQLEESDEVDLVKVDNDSYNDDYIPSQSDASESDAEFLDIDSENGDEGEEPENESEEYDANITSTNTGEWTDMTVTNSNFAEYNLQQRSALVEVDNDSSPEDIYNLFLTDDIWQMMVTETNLYASQVIASQELKNKSRMKQWADTTLPEMKKFVGILICMGLVKLPRLSLYWSKNNLYGSNLIKTTMPRDRFFLLLKFWHFANNENNNNSDRLYRINPLLEKLNRNFQNGLEPGKDVIIDESMVPWRGRLVFRQYIPNKAHAYGVKLYKVCTKNGYTWKTKVYSGKSDASAGTGHAEAVVMELMDGLMMKGRVLYTDNFYTSIPLAKQLLKKHTHICGTLRSNRKYLPKEITGKKLKKGEVIGLQKDGVKVLKWVDKRPVLMLTTKPEHIANLVDTGKTSRTGIQIKKPQCILDYNASKKGVDYGDQMASYYTCLRKGLKWYRKVAMELIFGTAIVNAWVLHSMYANRALPIIDFREKLARQLLDSNEVTSAVSKKRKHTLQRAEGPARKVRKRCVSCYKNLRRCNSPKSARNKTKQITTFCEDCPAKPFMCLGCFNDGHS